MLGLGIVCVRVRECVWWFCAGDCGIPSMLLPFTSWKPISQMSRSRSHRHAASVIIRKSFAKCASKLWRPSQPFAIFASAFSCLCDTIFVVIVRVSIVHECACRLHQSINASAMQKEINVPKTLFPVKIKTVMRGEHNELCNESNREWNLSAFAVGQKKKKNAARQAYTVHL